MGALSMIGQLVGSFPEIAPVWTPTPYEDVNKGRPLVKDAIEITLAEYNLDTKDMITAHHLKDYRQRTFRLAILRSLYDIGCQAVLAIGTSYLH